MQPAPFGSPAMLVVGLLVFAAFVVLGTALIWWLIGRWQRLFGTPMLRPFAPWYLIMCGAAFLSTFAYLHDTIQMMGAVPIPPEELNPVVAVMKPQLMEARREANNLMLILMFAPWVTSFVLGQLPESLAKKIAKA